MFTRREPWQTARVGALVEVSYLSIKSPAGLPGSSLFEIERRTKRASSRLSRAPPRNMRRCNTQRMP